MKSERIKLGFIAAGAMNIGGVLVFSRGLTNEVINQFDPIVMSNFGLLMIMVLGLAYLGTAFIQANVSWLAAAFAIEKLVYVIAWLMWIGHHSLADVYHQDLLAGLFYTIYGANDFVFMLFFLWVFMSQRRSKLADS